MIPMTRLNISGVEHINKNCQFDGFGAGARQTNTEHNSVHFFGEPFITKRECIHGLLNKLYSSQLTTKEVIIRCGERSNFSVIQLNHVGGGNNFTDCVQLHSAFIFDWQKSK